jgi:hypothetical protein
MTKWSTDRYDEDRGVALNDVCQDRTAIPTPKQTKQFKEVSKWQRKAEAAE